MKAGERTLQQLLYTGDQFVIPLFQRYYIWKQKNWDTLWEDIVTLLEADGGDRRHFLGSLVTVAERHQPGVVPAYQVIDGQQRLTTLSILLCAIRDAAKDARYAELAAEIEEHYLIHRFKRGQERYKLFLRLLDREHYNTLIDAPERAVNGNQPHTAYQHFLNRLGKEGHAESEARLRRLFEAVTCRLDFVAITLEGENPYQIFSSLNSKGEDLKEADLIRNYVFMAVPLRQQEEFDEAHWSPLEGHFKVGGGVDGDQFTAFLRDVLMHEGTYVGRDGTFEAFQKRFPAQGLAPYELLPDLHEKVRLYDVIRGKAPADAPDIEAALSHFRALETTTAYPLVLALLAKHRGGQIRGDDVASAITDIAGFILRRYVCGESSRAYGRWFTAACKVLDSRPRENLKTFFAEKGWPSDHQFVEGFYRLNLYHSDYAKAVLAGLELSYQNPNERVVLDQCEMEHVMPQTIEDDEDGRDWQAMIGPDWEAVHEVLLHTPGNLTLVGLNYNRSMSNRRFETKKALLADSRVCLNRHFADPELLQWGEAEIWRRARDLANRAAELWPGPSST